MEESTSYIKGVVKRGICMLLNPDILNENANKMFEDLKTGKYKKAALSSYNLSPARTASVLTGVGIDDASGCLKAMEKKRAGRVIAYMPPEFSVKMLREMPENVKINLMNNIPADNIDGILEYMDEDERNAVISKLDRKLKAHAEKIEKYPPESSGRLMSPHFLSIGQERTVGETLDSIMSAPAEIDRRPYVYVLNDDGIPVGVVSVKDLLRAPKNKKVKDIVRDNIVTVSVKDPAHDAAMMIRNRRLTMIPVLGENGVIEGVITFDDAMMVLSKDTLNLMTYSAGTYEESFFTPPMKAVRGRLPWMAANVFLNMGAVAVITSFEATIATVAILAAFIPMITDMGGNVGIQSLSVAIRSIALGEAKLRDYRKLIGKEIVIGIVNGFLLGTLFGVIAFALRGNPFLGLLAGVALGVNVLIAGIAGGALPFLIKACGKDPAMMTGPFLTTITDITGVSIYLTLSTMFIVFLI